MYHSITFLTNESIIDTYENTIKYSKYSKNTYDSWLLIPTKRPDVAPAVPKNRTIDVPGMNGVADFSTALTGYPLYQNRTGSWTFMIDHWDDRYHDNWVKIYSEVMDWLQGKKDYICIFEDDQSWYYKGKFTVSGFDSGDKYSTITISYELYPYKRAAYISEGSWLWDPFDFEEGIIPTHYTNSKQVVSSSWKDVYFDLSNAEEWYYVFGSEPVIPVIKVIYAAGNDTAIKFSSKSLNKPNYILSIPPTETETYISDYHIVLGGACIEDFTKPIVEYTKHGLIKGDIDNDGKLSISDVSSVKREYVLILNGEEPTFTPLEFECADMDEDGVLSINDCLAIEERYINNSSVLDYNNTFRIQAKGNIIFSLEFRPGRL